MKSFSIAIVLSLVCAAASATELLSTHTWNSNTCEAVGALYVGPSQNQPLAAIQNFADSGRKLIDRGREEDASENFKLITQQIHRMSRIIRSLRAFARKEKETVEPVDLQNVITESINLATVKCEQESVTIIRKGDKTPVCVMGGQVRLQQVVINLITMQLMQWQNRPKK